MMVLLRIWWLGFEIVALTAANVMQISQGHVLGAFACGAAISWVWWRNSRTANRVEGLAAQAVYAFGAGCGTVAGMWLTHLLYR